VLHAKSATWVGKLRAPRPGKVQLELAAPNRDQARGRAWIDGQVVLDLSAPDASKEGSAKKVFMLEERLHKLRLELSDPGDGPWQFSLAELRKGWEAGPLRDVFDPRDLYHPKVPETQRADRIPLHDGSEAIEFVAEVKVDTTVPRTELSVTSAALGPGSEGARRIRLSHREYAYRRGGLRGRYFRTTDFKKLICERVDSSVYFFHGREALTRAVPGAHSAVWEGGLYVPATHEAELELAIWRPGEAGGRVLVDGDVVIELVRAETKAGGFKKQKVSLTEGMHTLHLEFRGPRNVRWRFALFQWGQGPKGQSVRDPLGPKELYYLENLGTTYYRWNNGPLETYTTPIRLLPGKNVLRFHTVDQAGHVEPEQLREFDVPVPTSGPGTQTVGPGDERRR